jgi:L-ascorbate metabolism protein UlaG (beta-lactamase superfamily)
LIGNSDKKSMKFTFLGHSAGYLETGSDKFLFDPFLTGNPKASVSADQVSPTYILLTHGHSDHVGDAVTISKRRSAPIITTFELANWLGAQGADTVALNHGGWCKFSFGRVRFTIAFHSSSVIEEGGRPLYLGEPALFSDMRLIGEDASVDLALLPIGEQFTMGPKDAAKAVEFLAPRRVVPIHYGTFPPLVGDPQEFARLAKGTGAEIHVLRPGESLDF